MLATTIKDIDSQVWLDRKFSKLARLLDCSHPVRLGELKTRIMVFVKAHKTCVIEIEDDSREGFAAVILRSNYHVEAYMWHKPLEHFVGKIEV